MEKVREEKVTGYRGAQEHQQKTHDMSHDGP
jgi:hypothetical protein